MSTQGLDIILVSPHAHYPSHYWSNTLALKRALAERGVDTHTVVFSSDTELIQPSTASDVQPAFRTMPSWWRRFATGKTQRSRVKKLLLNFETIACLLKALQLARRCNAPVLHWIGGAHWPVFIAAVTSRHVRFVYSLYGRLVDEKGAHGVRGWGQAVFERLVQRAVRSGRLDFVCETELIRDNAAALVGARVHLVPYAIDTRKPVPEKLIAREQLGLPTDEKIFLFFGTHRLEKDYRTALRGCLLLPELPLALFVGKVISANDPRIVVSECGYPKARIVDEFVTDTLADLYFAAADVVVLPYEENFARGSGVLIESCRYQRPMLVSAAPYLSAFINRYKCGETFEPRNPRSFADAAARLLANPAVYLPGLAQAKHDHSWDVVIEQYIVIYSGQACSTAS